MNPDAAVVFNEAELAKAIHEEAHTRPGGANHFCQSFLRDLWDQRFWFSRLAKLRQQQEDPRQTLFAGVEKLIDKIGLGSHATRQQELQEQVGELMLLVKNTDDLPPLNLESQAGGNRSGSRQAKAGRSGNRLFPNKFACGDKCYRGLFAACRNDGKACATLLKIENGVSGVSL